MKKIIKKVTYNTDTAELITSKAYGNFGDTDGFEEKLYVTKKGQYFLHGIGGTDSKYPVEQLVPLTKKEKENWETN